MKLAIGTVQFGLNYGIANASGRASPQEAARILTRARDVGIDTVDTAAAYGDSEKVLGDIGMSHWRVVSKIPPLPAGVPDGRAWVRDHVNRSLVTLGVNRLDGLLLHNAVDLLDPRGPGLIEGLREARAEGLTGKIGYSIYSPQPLPYFLDALEPDLVQAPLSVFDQRLLRSGWLNRLAELGTEVHVRSVFLQGLLLMTAGTRATSFDRWEALWQRWDALVETRGGDRGVAALSLCLGFVKAQQAVARIVVGVQSLDHLDQLLSAWDHATWPDDVDLSCEDPLLLDPFNWKPS
jgi:aryl-alcohol dehydrogenase-like predicted oxidoreductase